MDKDLQEAMDAYDTMEQDAHYEAREPADWNRRYCAGKVDSALSLVRMAVELQDENELFAAHTAMVLAEQLLCVAKMRLEVGDN